MLNRMSLGCLRLNTLSTHIQDIDAAAYFKRASAWTDWSRGTVHIIQLIGVGTWGAGSWRGVQHNIRIYVQLRWQILGLQYCGYLSNCVSVDVQEMLWDPEVDSQMAVPQLRPRQWCIGRGRHKSCPYKFGCWNSLFNGSRHRRLRSSAVVFFWSGIHLENVGNNFHLILFIQNNVKIIEIPRCSCFRRIHINIMQIPSLESPAPVSAAGELLFKLDATRGAYVYLCGRWAEGETWSSLEYSSIHHFSVILVCLSRSA